MRRKEESSLFPEMPANENNCSPREIVKAYFGIRVINTFRVDRSPSDCKEAYRIIIAAGPDSLRKANFSLLRTGVLLAALGNYRLIHTGVKI